MRNLLQNTGIIWLIAGVHLLLLAAAYLAGKKRRRALSPGEIFLCVLLPVFGPVCGLELVLTPDPDPALLKDMIMREDPIRTNLIDPEPIAAQTAPMEESFLINDPHVRREMMMKLLHENPEENLELLMLARFNDDPETAHYATATLTEYQRRSEMSLQQSQSLLSREPDNTQQRLIYIGQLEKYIDSGLLEGHLLLRQRALLEKELGTLPENEVDLALGCLRVRNLLAMQQPRDAEACARRLIDRFPGAEEPWLECMRICVDSHDAAGLRKLQQEIRTQGILWSYQGQEKMEYILRGIGKETGKESP